MAAQAAVEAAAPLKAQGNASYGSGDYEGAIGAYGQAIDALQAYTTAAVTEGNDESKGGDEARSMLATLLSNRAQCHIKVGKYMAAAADCTACLVLDESNVKALFRRATALEKMGQAKAALRDFAEVGRLDPSQAKAVAKARRRVTKAIRAAFAGGRESGTGGRAPAKRGGNGGGNMPSGGVRVDGLTYEEASELQLLQQRKQSAQRDFQRAQNEVKRLNIVGRELQQDGIGNVFTACGKMYVRQPIDKAKSMVAKDLESAQSKVASTGKAAETLDTRLNKLVSEYQGLQQQRLRQMQAMQGRK